MGGGATEPRATIGAPQCTQKTAERSQSSSCQSTKPSPQAPHSKRTCRNMPKAHAIALLPTSTHTIGLADATNRPNNRPTWQPASVSCEGNRSPINVSLSIRRVRERPAAVSHSNRGIFIMRYACLLYFDPKLVFNQSPEAEAALRDGATYL